eukprot:TRINITY_DN68485_c0_g1_i1.p1 TRINITY_DN68485_c0_g1~~TRINITY_DN68485_c0_g1_i1.p1  ORF type:complete len:386 (-),score=52.52 TRINITY_DN68485_c0_g1_i1:174-1331(-)
MAGALLRAARAETKSPVWQRPSSGAGSRSASADPRIRLQPLEPLQGFGRCGGSAGPTRPGFEADGVATPCASRSTGRSKRKNSNSSVGSARPMDSPTPWTTEEPCMSTGAGGRHMARTPSPVSFAARGPANVVHHKRPQLLRQRRGRSPGTHGASPATTEDGDSVCEEHDGRFAFRSERKVESVGQCSDDCSEASDGGGRESSSTGGLGSDTDNVWQAELEEIDAELEKRHRIVQKLQATQGLLQSRLNEKVTASEGFLKNAKVLESRIAATEEDMVHVLRTPRRPELRLDCRKDRSSLGKSAEDAVKSNPPLLDTLIDKWSKTTIAATPHPSAEANVTTPVVENALGPFLTAAPESPIAIADAESPSQRLRARRALGLACSSSP